MVQVIECGERTIQTKCRIAITDIANKYDLKPGDSVIVDLRIKSKNMLGSEVEELYTTTPRIMLEKEKAFCERQLTHLKYALEDENIPKESKSWVKDVCKMLKLHIKVIEGELRSIKGYHLE